MVLDISKIEAYDETNLRALEKKLGISIEHRWLLKSAITSPKAYEKTLSSILSHNLTYIERLAFIGDSVLYNVSSDYVLKKFKDENKRENLHNEREKYKKNENLKKITDLDCLVDYFWNEENTIYDSKPWKKLMGTFMEAIIGALYLDEKNIETAREFIVSYIIPKIDNILRTN